MATAAKSVRYDVSLKRKYKGVVVSSEVEKATEKSGLYISHIGSYSRVKYPNSIHWHFKQRKKL